RSPRSSCRSRSSTCGTGSTSAPARSPASNGDSIWAMGALDGIKVIDAGLLVQGPQAAATMREWGAEVIKVELPGVGDQARWLPARDGDMRSGYFIAC